MTEHPFTNHRYLNALADHVVLFDGATGTQLARYEPTVEDYGGVRTTGLNEMLLFHRPDLVERVHRAYLAAGAEVIKTNSFRANRITLGEFGVADRTPEINRRAASIARRVADEVSEETGRACLVAGSMGPTGKLPSLDDPELSDVSFEDLVAIYAEYAHGLLEGGVDLLLIETQQDLLELKAAVHGAWRAFHHLDVRVPIQAQMTLEMGGRMLTGPDVEAVTAMLSALPVEVIGMNCSTGPEEMRDSVRRLLAFTNRPASVIPNAGMPENVGGQAVYRMQPEPFSTTMAEFVDWGVRAVGGCCGTGPEHIAALKEQLEVSEKTQVTLPITPPTALPFAASNIQAVALHQEPRPLIVGERINTQGSRRARRLVLEERYEALLQLAETQVDYGAHVLDVCLALTERDDEAETMTRVVKMLSLNTPAPLMFDTTDPEVMRSALKTYPGRPIINSVNLGEGEEHARQILDLAHEHGAALIALTIDEEGMARTADRKLEVAHRLYRLAVEEVGLAPHALIFDPLTFTLATGGAKSTNAAVETLEALCRIHEELPGTLTNLGVSNVSYGLKPPARRVLNSVFLYHAVQAGLDLAIVNPAQITPYPDIPEETRALADNLIFNRHADALADYVAHFEGKTEVVEATPTEAHSPEEALYAAVLHRHREGIEALVDAALEKLPPIQVLNEILLPAMKEVGDHFGAGEIILPFVLKSAEVMKAAVSHLEPHMERDESASRGTVVLATVFGDVHDIGKNLVKTILANNGYTVHDLGKQVPVDTIVEEAVAKQADAIGLSALLVATSKQMQRVVEALQRRGLAIPVLVGGAAVNPEFALRIAVGKEGTPYAGGVHYCRDAFEALQVLEHVVMHKPSPPVEHHHAPEGEGTVEQVDPSSATAGCASCSACTPPLLLSRTTATVLCPTAPEPPFWGTHVIEEMDLDEIRPHLNEKSLFRVGWGAKGARGEKWKAVKQDFETRLARMWPKAPTYLKPQAVYGYFPAQAEGNDLIVYNPSEPLALEEVARFTFPRQTSGQNLCLADYFASVESRMVDVVAFQIVTVGATARKRYEELEEAGEVSEAYFVHGLASQAAEATAEFVHRRIRRELDLPDEQSKRYSWGYPPCPDVTQHHLLFKLLPAQTALSMSLTPAGQLSPEHSTAALIVHHPEARYFVVQ